ncbi:MAG TPA: cytochrome P450 [Actinomycetota bacterium]|nr:cytochrome P450 [Actinomycetota bacterium]
MAMDQRLGGELPPEEPVFYNPLDPEVHADPYPQYRRLREEAPMLRGPLGYWVVSRHADIAGVLRDPRFGVGMDEAALLQATLEGPGAATVAELSRWMLFRDPPDHTRLRSLVSKAFTPRALEALRPRIQQVVDDLIDGFEGREDVDLIAELALPLPVTMISELLGMPVEDQGQAREWAEAIAQVLDPIVTEEQATRADRAVRELAAYIAEAVGERRRRPGSDVLSRLIQARGDGPQGGRLSEAELISTVALLFGAGHETTRNLIGNGMLALLRHPAELERLRRDPGLTRSAVEELLRYDSPVQLMGRGAREDAVVGGERVAAGEALMLLIGAANRDPAQFPDPDRLDVGRSDVKMLSFGGGIHFCLGAMLARTEGQIAIGTLLSRVRSLELATDALQWRSHITLRGLTALPVRIGAVATRDRD